MKRPAFGFVCGVCFLFAAAFGIHALDENAGADSILAAVRANLPRQPFLLQGDLMRSNLHQLPERIASFEAAIDFVSEPVSAVYTLYDRFGTEVVKLKVARPAGKPSEIAFEARSGTTPPARLDERIADSDLTWNDLSLAFLWWSGGINIGRERVLGRECYVIEYPLAPRDSPPGTAMAARLWVDVKLLALLQVDERDSTGARLRRVQAKDFKKIAGLWMIKNMEARNYVAKTRTLIQVRTLRSLSGEDDEAEGDAEGNPASTLPLD